jgi:hypothetical protein
MSFIDPKSQIGQLADFLKQGHGLGAYAGNPDERKKAAAIWDGVNIGVNIVCAACPGAGNEIAEVADKGIGKAGQEFWGIAYEAAMRDLARTAVENAGHGIGAQFGTAAHSNLSGLVKEAGGPNLWSEVSYMDGKVVPYGTNGSIRVDRIAGTPEAPTLIGDLKTGAAKLTPRRIEQIPLPLARSVQRYQNNRDKAVTKRAFSRLTRCCANVHPGLISKENLLLLGPLSHFFNGFLFENSSKRNFFYPWSVIQLLTVPSTHFVLSLGHRLSHGVSADDPVDLEKLHDLIRVESQSLAAISDVWMVADIIRKHLGKMPQYNEHLAHCSILTGEYEDAKNRLESILSDRKGFHHFRPAAMERIEQIRTMLNSDVVQARNQLLTWEEETVKGLGLIEYWVRDSD